MTRPLDEILTRGLEAGVPGLSGVVVSSTQLIACKAIGVRRAGTTEPVTTHDRFHLGSNAKAMLATLAACLVEDGSLDWTTTISEAFADLGDQILEPYRDVTMAMLLQHRAGVPPYTDDEAADFVLPDDTKGNLDATSFARWIIRSRPPLVQPGSAFSYSNAGYAIVAAMLEAIAGEQWDSLIRRRVFEPLAISGGVGQSWPAKQDPAQPWGHLLENGTALPHPPDAEYQLQAFLAPAGDISMSMRDYGRFLQLHVGGLRGAATILSSETIRRLHNDREIGTGFGWGVTRLRSLERLGVFSTHAGSAGTFVTAAAISHEHDRAFAIAMNAGIETQFGDWLKALIEVYLKD